MKTHNALWAQHALALLAHHTIMIFLILPNG